jgi:DNA methylase
MTTWSTRTNQRSAPTPYEKPREVLGHILARVCRRGDVVLDPFAGSGSSRVATEKLGLDLFWKGRGYYRFRGFGRCATGPDGSFRIVTLKPGPLPTPYGGLEAPPLDVSVFARGLLDRVVTRMYFPDEQIANAAAPVLRSIGEPARRTTLIAVPEPEEELRFNIRLQGEYETVFFDV